MAISRREFMQWTAAAGAGTLAGVIVQFGGQTPLKLAQALEDAGVPILGTSPDAIDLAEDRERFAALRALPGWLARLAPGFGETRIVAALTGALLALHLTLGILCYRGVLEVWPYAFAVVHPA